VSNFEKLLPLIYAISGTIVGGLIGFLTSWGMEKRKRIYLANDFREGIISEIKEALVRLVSFHYLTNVEQKTIDEEKMNWELSMLSELESVGAKKLREEIKVAIDRFREGKLDQVIGIATDPLVKISSSILNEKISSFSMLEPEFRAVILRVRSNISTINYVVEKYHLYSEKNLDIEDLGTSITQYPLIEIHIKAVLYSIGTLSLETALLIKECISTRK